MFSGLVKQIGTNHSTTLNSPDFEDVSVSEIYAYDAENGVGTLMWSKTKPTGENADDFLGTELTDRGNPTDESCGWSNKSI